MNPWIRMTDPTGDPVMLAIGMDDEGLRMQMCLVRLWCHCSACRRDGRFAAGRVSCATQVESAASWTGEEGAFMSALVRSGAIVGSEDEGFVVVNGGRWGAMDGVQEEPSMRQRRTAMTNAERQAAYRARKRMGVTDGVTKSVTPAVTGHPGSASNAKVTGVTEIVTQSNVAVTNNNGSNGMRNENVTNALRNDQNLTSQASNGSNESVTQSNDCSNGGVTKSLRSFHIEERAQEKDKDKDYIINTPPLPPHGGQGLVAGDDQGQDDELEARMLEDLRRSRSSDASTAQASSPASPAAHPHQPAVPASGAVATAGTPKPGHADLQVLFDQFWAAWPKKVAKAEAEKAFRQAFSSPSAPSLETVLTAISRQNADLRWARENFRYCPNPATWLRGRRWDDVCQQDVSSGTGFRRAVVPSMAQIRSVPLSGDASDCQEQTLSRDHLALIQRGRIIERIQKAIVEGRPVLRSEFQTLQASAIAAACRKAGITPDDIQIVEGA